jgi:DNA invertase Pin-like site-specific DNA recombinase
MTADDIAVAKTLLANSDISVKEVARRQGVSVSTLYKHIPAARATVTRQEPA